MLKIITADERAAEKTTINGVIGGKSGIGKTSLLWTLPADSTLFFDLEAGDLAVEGWQGDSIRPKTWAECRDFAVYIGGPNPALPSDAAYSQAHYDDVMGRFGDPSQIAKYETVFIDSITVAGRLCFTWASQQPESFNNQGKPDVRNAYGLHGREMLKWLTHLQHTRDKNIWFVGILDEKVDDYNRTVFSLQIEGSKTGLELPGIVDEVITMAEIPFDENTSARAFVCQTINPYGLPAKDRSGRLDVVEEPHLGKLMAKIAQPLKRGPERIDSSLPAPAQADTTN